jgi:hypothetical protein
LTRVKGVKEAASRVLENEGLRVTALLWSCREASGRAGRWVGKLSTFKENGGQEEEEDNAETRRAQSFRGEEGETGRGWKSIFTGYLTASRDDLSSYFLCSNDSNGVRIGRKLISGLRMRENLALKNGICERSG